MYQVLDNGKPADCMHFNVLPSYSKSSFESLKAARAHAQAWVGEAFPLPLLVPGTPIKYCGRNEIEIRSVNSDLR